MGAALLVAGTAEGGCGVLTLEVPTLVDGCAVLAGRVVVEVVAGSCAVGTRCVGATSHVRPE